MKKIFSIICIALVAAVALVGCREDEYEEEVPTLTVAKSDVTFSAKAGTGTIEVVSESAITASSDQSWCTVSVSGKTVTVAVPMCTDVYSRNAVVTIKNGEGDSARVPVSQSGAIWDVENEDSYLIAPAGGSVKFTFRTDYDYTVTPSDDWITTSYDEKNHEMTISAAATSEKLRKGSITIASEKADVEIGVVQFDGSNLAGTWTISYDDWDSSYEDVPTTKTVSVTKSSSAANTYLLEDSQPLPPLRLFRSCSTPATVIWSFLQASASALCRLPAAPHTISMQCSLLTSAMCMLPLSIHIQLQCLSMRMVMYASTSKILQMASPTVEA